MFFRKPRDRLPKEEALLTSAGETTWDQAGEVGFKACDEKRKEPRLMLHYWLEAPN